MVYNIIYNILIDFNKYFSSFFSKHILSFSIILVQESVVQHRYIRTSGL